MSTITKALKEEQIIVSQSLRKMRDAKLVKTNRRGIFIYYSINEEYPASIFTCLRRLYGYMTDDFQYLQDRYKVQLPTDYTIMAANRIKLFANYEKMRILEFLTLYGNANVSEIISGIDSEQIKVSQYLKRLKEDGFVTRTKQGRYVIYNITKGIHKTCIECIHKRYEKLKNKEDF